MERAKKPFTLTVSATNRKTGEKRQYNNVYDIFFGFEMDNREGFVSYLRLMIDGEPPERIYVYLTEDDVTITAGGEDKNIVRRIYGK